MNRRILVSVAAPAVLIGLLLCGACLVSAWYVNQLQVDMRDILAKNVTSLRSAQQLEICVRQLRLRCFAYLIDPAVDLLQRIREDDERFQAWLILAEQAAFTADEQACLQNIKEGYVDYQHEFERLRAQLEQSGPRRDFRKLADAGPLRPVIDACRKYAQLNDVMMADTAQQSATLSQRLGLILLVLGIGGPLSGLVSGYGIARGLSRSLHRLSVRVHDVAHRLDEDVAAVQLIPDGDLHHLDRQLDHVVGRVAEVMGRLQRQQHAMLRAQQLAAVGQLAASVAHEVRNPLTAIKMMVEVGLRERQPRPFTQEKLRIVHGEILRLEQSVQNFLDFARPPALRREACDLCDLLARSLDLVRARAQQQKVVLGVERPEQARPALVDRGQLCSVFVNLLLNALDAMPHGGVLTVTLRYEEASGFTLTVSDTGVGIAATVADQLFEPFVSTRATGSGLGLSICKRVVEEHGGVIRGTNRAAGGACFTVVLPLLATEECNAPSLACG